VRESSVRMGVTMATKKHQTHEHARSRKRTGKSAAPGKRGPHSSPPVNASKLKADFDADPLDLKPPQAERAAALEREESETRSAGQSGSLEGLSDLPGADSESVDELIEEGNAFEAGVVKGVEDAPDADQGEIKTHEVAEDDVPDEYLDNEP